MSDDLLLNGTEEQYFATDALEVIRLKKEVKRLNSLIKAKETLHEKAVAKLEAVKKERPIPEEAGNYLDCLMLMALFLDTYHNVNEPDDPVELTRVRNVDNAIHSWFGKISSRLGLDKRTGPDRLVRLARLLQDQVFYFNGNGTKVGARPDMSNSPIYTYEKAYEAWDEDQEKS